MRFRRKRRVSGGRHEVDVDVDLKTALDDAPVMVRATGPDPTECAWCNRSWLSFRGRPLVEELGTGWVDGVHPADQERVLAGYRQAGGAAAAFTTEYALRGIDDRYRTVAERGHPRFDDDGTLIGYLVSAHDVTDQRTVRASLEQRTQQRAAIADLGRAALGGRDFHDLASDAARLVADALALDTVVVLELQPDGDLRPVASRGPRRVRLTRSLADEEQVALARDAIVLAEPIVVDDWVKHRRAESGEPEGARRIRSSCCAPIRSPGGVVGALAAHSPHPGDFTTDDVNFIRSVANILGAALARQRVESELRASETRLRLALDAGRMGTWEWSPASDTVSWSTELEALFGVSPGSFAGDFGAYLERVHPEDRDLVLKVIETAVDLDTQIEMEHRVILQDGTVRWVEGRGSRVLDSPEPKWTGVAIDINDRKSVEHERERLLELEQATRHALEETVARLDTLLEHSPVAFAFFDGDLRFATVNAPFAAITGWTVEEHSGRALEEMLPDLAEQIRPGLDRVLETRAAVVDIEATGRQPGTSWFERHFLISGYPVQQEGGEVFGVGVVFVDNTVRKRQSQAALLVARTSELYATESDMEATLQAAVSIVIPEFADSCQLYLFETSVSEQRVVVGHADDATRELMADAVQRWPIDLAAAREAVTDTRPRRIASISAEMQASFAKDDDHLRLMQEHGSRSTIVAPLVARGDVIGLLMFNYTDLSGRRYRRADADLAEELARRLAQAIDGARSREETRHYQERLDVLARVGELVAVELDPNARMRRFVRGVVPGLADVCLVHLRDADGCFTLEQFAAADDRVTELFRTADTWPDLPADVPSPNRDAFSSRQPVLVSEVVPERFSLYDPDVVGAGRRTAAEQMGIASLLCAPMLDEQGAPFGTITFLYGWSGRRYTDADIPFAQELARRAAASYRHAERFQQERATAETLQRSLLPQQAPVVPGVLTAARYLPGGESERVGGDWYDVFALPDGTVLFAIGDVVGHGLSAASSTGLLRSAAQLAALDRLRPAAMLDQLNQWLLVLPDADMATVTVATYDPRSRVLRYASAGHPPTLRMRGGTKVQFLGGALGPPLRASATTSYRERRIRLKEGDVLLLYTDGLVERRGESIDDGLERLRQTLAAAPRDLERMSDHVLEHSLPVEGPADDVAMLAVRVGADVPDVPAQRGRSSTVRRRRRWFVRGDRA